MRRLLALAGMALLVGALLVRAASVGGRGGGKGWIEPYGSRSYRPLAFKGGEKATVIVNGTGRTYMGLYIYDQHGSCVAWDDLGAKGVKDDLAVEWYPPHTGLYTIEIRNFGHLPNFCQRALR